LFKNSIRENVFHPPSASHAREVIKGKNDKTLFQNPFEFSKVLDLDEKHYKKSKILYGDFIPASKKRLRDSATRNARVTIDASEKEADKYLTAENKYEVFLEGSKNESRLSIL
jgi:hypothetical protein